MSFGSTSERSSSERHSSVTIAAGPLLRMRRNILMGTRMTKNESSSGGKTKSAMGIIMSEAPI